MSLAPSRSRVPAATARHADVIIVGAGFAGLGMAIRMLQDGRRDFLVLDRGRDVGGTWRDNTYPGCACDVQSHLYSFSFELNPAWSRMFATQPEIQAYLQHCSTKYGVTPHLRLGRDIISARWMEDETRWELQARGGERFTCRVLVAGMGGLSTPSFPSIPGLEKFQGTTFHSAQWNHDHDLSGRRVGVIGTGASAIQFVPRIAPVVKILSLFQRTPPWIMARPDAAIPPWVQGMFRALPFTQWMFRGGIYAVLEGRVLGFAVNPRWMMVAEKSARKHLEKQVPDEALRARLTPDYRAGCKRILISNDYYPALQLPQVDLVTDAIREVTADGIITADGKQHDLDTIILGTGFTPQNPVPRGMVTGVGGRDLWDAWPQGAEAYKGTTVAGFPNLFFLVGPNTGLGHTSMVYMIESQVAYVVDALREMDERAWRAVDVNQDAQATYNAQLQRDLAGTIWLKGGCHSWYLNENGRNTTLWPTFTFRFRAITARFDMDAYASLGADGRWRRG